MSTPEICPYCQVSLIGDPIPDESRQYYGSNTHFSRVIALYSRERDMTVAWRCPDCLKKWDRK